MCLAGPAMPQQPAPAKARVVEPGPPSPNDKVNNVEVENINDRSQQQARRQANRGQTASKQNARTSSQTNKAY